MPSNEIMSVEGQLVGMPLAGPESFSEQQLTYLKRALGVDETVLWTASSSAGESSATLSEAFTNFEKLYIRYRTTDKYVSDYILYTDQEATTFAILGCNYNGTNMWLKPTRFSISSTSITTSAGAQYSFSDNAVTRSSTTSQITLLKVTGVHRISGGN